MKRKKLVSPTNGQRYWIIIVVNIILSLSLLLSPPQAKAKLPNSKLQGDGFLRLFNYHLNQFEEFQFRDSKGRLIPKTLEKINVFLRSREKNETTSIDPSLLDLIDHLQDHFQIDTVEVISAFRSEEFNQKLLKNGHSVSPVSYHTQGKAMDIHFDEITEESLQQYALSLAQAGVGYYGNLDFVHIDVGPVRKWIEGKNDFKRIGVMNPKHQIQLSTSKNDHFTSDKVLFEWKGLTAQDLNTINALSLQRFHRGNWVFCTKTKLEAKTLHSLSLQQINCQIPERNDSWGKYRILFQFENETLSSNEFYFKKK